MNKDIDLGHGTIKKEDIFKDSNNRYDYCKCGKKRKYKQTKNNRKICSNCGKQILLHFNYRNMHKYSYAMSLKPLKPNLKILKFVAFDVETINDNKDFICGSLYSEKEIKFFTKRESMINYMLDEKNKNTIYVATNLKFDLGDLIQQNFSKYNLKDPIMRGGGILCVKTKKNNIKFWDTMNFFVGSVEKMGEVLNLPKLEKPSYWNKDNTEFSHMPKNKKEWQEMKEYNIRDSEITYKFMNFLQKGLNDIGCSLKMTIASTALNYFQEYYLDATWYREEFKYHGVQKKIFKSYYGGRTELFGRGLTLDVNYGDVNSMYPFSMKNKFPEPNSVKIIKNPDKEIINEFEGVSHVLIYAPYMYYPILPHRNDKIIFPYGYLKGWYTHVELRYAISQGYKLIQIYESVFYKYIMYPFDKWIDDLYKLRKHKKENKDNTEVCIKLLMNSLYGKFASKQNSIVEFYNQDNYMDIYDNLTEYELRHSDSVDYKTRTGYISYKKEVNEGYVFPIISSYVTAYARIHLHKLMVKYNALYVDTDSIFTRKKISNDLELGGIKTEARMSICEIVRPKFYNYLNRDTGECIVKMKGISSKDKNVFDNLVNGKIYTYKKITTLKEGIRKGLKANQTIIAHKQIDIEDNKRIWLRYYNRKTFDEDSKPLYIDDRRRDKRKLYKEIKDIKETYINARYNKMRILNDYVSKSVGFGFVNEFKAVMLKNKNSCVVDLGKIFIDPKYEGWDFKFKVEMIEPKKKEDVKKTDLPKLRK